MNFKCCLKQYLHEMHSFLLVDEYFEEFGVCAHCYWNRELEGKDIKPRSYYFVKMDGNAYVARLEMKTGSGFNLVILPQSNGKIFVGIERLSCFHFSGWCALMPPGQSAEYIAEKLYCSPSDAA